MEWCEQQEKRKMGKSLQAQDVGNSLDLASIK
jgi:hypothetical protein